jgi:uncharacterized protein YbjQ (UPF0145 family)
VSVAGDIGQKIESIGNTIPGGWFQEIFGSGSIFDLLISNAVQVVGVGVVGWLIAAWFERRHLKSMSIREIPLTEITISTSKQVPDCEPEGCALLIGSVVVAHDYFRTLIIFIRRMIGGNIRPYERLVQRGRREALIRLKEEAELRAIDKVINVRFTTTAISGRFLHAVEMVAYGTGIKTISR